MKLKRFLIALITLCLISLGCGAKHCLKLDGDFGENKKGGLEYCIDLTNTQKESRLVLTGQEGKTWGIKEDELKKLLDKAGIGDVKASSIKPDGKAELLTTGERLKEALK